MNSSTRTVVRPSWDELPRSLRDGLADRLGAITTAQVQDGGFTPGLAARLQLASGERLRIPHDAATLKLVLAVLRQPA